MSHNNKLVPPRVIESKSQSQPSQEGSSRSESKEKLPKISLEEKMKLNPKTFDNDVVIQFGFFEFKTLCSKHIDEQVCFYSFTHKQALCSECLLSGAYNGCDVLSMKKAADRLKPDYERLLEEINGKIKESNVYRDELVNKKKEFQTLALDYQKEAYRRINILRELVNQKEKELMENLESIKMAKQMQIEAFYQNIKRSQNNLSNVHKIVQSKFYSGNDIEVCEYYHNKTGIIRDFLEREISDSHDLRFTSQCDDFRDLEIWNQEMDQIIKSIDKLSNMKEMKPPVVRKIEDMKRADFQNMISRSFGMENIDAENKEEEEETVFETEADGGVEIFSVPKFVTEPEEDHHQFLDRASASPFQALRRDLEPISPMKCAANDETLNGLSVTDDTLKFFLKVEDYKKTTQVVEQQGEGLTNSTKKFKDLNLSNIDQQPTFRKRGYTGGLLSNNKSPGAGESLTSKRHNLKTFNLSENKHIPRSFLPGSLSVNTQPYLLTTLTMSAQRLMSPTGLKSPSQIGMSKLNNNKTVVGGSEPQKLRFRSEGKSPSSATLAFEGSNFAKNIRRLQKQLDINGKIH